MRDIKKYTEAYNEPNFEDYQIMYRRKQILEILNKYQPQSILEIGCGMEPLFKYIDFEYTQYTIVEPSEIFFENAVALADGDKRILFYKQYFSATEDLKKKEYDFIICSSLLHELEEPISLIKEIADVCNRNTIVHINVPNANSFHRVLAKQMGLIKDLHQFSERNKLLQQHSVYDMEELEECVNLCGFKVLEKGDYFFKPFAHSQMYDMIDKGIINEKVLDGLYGITSLLPNMGSEIFVNCKLLSN